MQKNVQKQVKLTKDKVLKFQKKYAIAKAAEVIQVFEKLAEKDPRINIKKLRKNVLNNLVDRNQDKDPNTEYWSMQLLIKLGLVPDPDEEHEGISMTKEER